MTMAGDLLSALRFPHFVAFDDATNRLLLPTWCDEGLSRLDEMSDWLAKNVGRYDGNHALGAQGDGAGKRYGVRFSSDDDAALFRLSWC